MDLVVVGQLPIRQPDGKGDGAFGASRGNRSHTGIDFACYPGTVIGSQTTGKVTKMGFPYGDAPSYRYVQITDSDGYDHRHFYIEPSVVRNQYVAKGDPIGVSQDIVSRYPADTPEGMMTNHMHYEIIKNGDKNKYFDPIEFWS